MSTSSDERPSNATAHITCTLPSVSQPMRPVTATVSLSVPSLHSNCVEFPIMSAMSVLPILCTVIVSEIVLDAGRSRNERGYEGMKGLKETIGTVETYWNITGSSIMPSTMNMSEQTPWESRTVKWLMLSSLRLTFQYPSLLLL